MKKCFCLLWVVFFVYVTCLAQTKSTREHIDNGNQWFDKGKYNQAIEQYSMALQIDSNCDEARNELANTYYTVKDYAHALEQSTRLRQSKSKFKEDAYIVNANSLDMLNRRTEAIAILKEGILAYPSNHLMYYYLGSYYSKNKNFKAAQDILDKGLSLKPLHPNTNALLGYVLNETGNHAQSLLCLYTYLLLDPLGNRAKYSIQLIDSQFHLTSTVNLVNASKPAAGSTNSHLPLAEAALLQLKSAAAMDGNKNKSWSDVMISNTTSLFKALTDEKLNPKDGWVYHFAHYFSTLQSQKHTEAFCYYISQIKDSPLIKTWLTTHKDQVEAFLRWNAEYER